MATWPYLHGTAGHRALFERYGIVQITGEILPQDLNLVRGCLNLAIQRDLAAITLEIDSHGGDYDVALSIGGLLQSRQGLRITGHVTGMAESAASVILMHCHHRVAVPSAQFCIHWGMHCLENGQLHSIMTGQGETVLEHIRRFYEQMMGIYLARSTMTREQTLELMSHEVRFPAQEALKLGLIDEILPWFTEK